MTLRQEDFSGYPQIPCWKNQARFKRGQQYGEKNDWDYPSGTGTWINGTTRIVD
ncbi:MAG: hypothetical protein PHU06_12580 [Gallionella sp.]|nr:hypothetical protein [Gallionella sp.]MDD4959423.1 hypothetical protein [Gallionella sp.]